MAGITRKPKPQPASPGENPAVQSDDSPEGIGRRPTRPVDVDAQWQPIDRTAAWEELWGRIFRVISMPEDEELPDKDNGDRHD